MIKGLVAIVGRPNVGKSTLFNKLTRTRQAIVDDTPGVTRDRLFGTCHTDSEKMNGFTIIDTGGFETEGCLYQPFKENLVWEQTLLAIDQADIVLLLLDGKQGMHQYDKELAQLLKQKEKKVIFAVNKIDGIEKESHALEFYALNPTELLTVSAAHSRGVSDLKYHIEDQLKNSKTVHTLDPVQDSTKIALIGRPNVGKSSLLNRLTNEERSVVSDIAGTTRDCIDTLFHYNKRSYTIVDTAGIRRKTKIKEFIETQSIIRSLNTIDQSDIVVFVIDAIEGLSDQDKKLINLAIDRYKPVLLVVNKWDLIPEKTSKSQQEYRYTLQTHLLKDLNYIPIHFVSCKENKRVFDMMKHIETIVDQSNRKAPTSVVNEILQEVIASHSPSLMRRYSKRSKFYYATQVAKNPPTIVIKCNVAEEIQPSYKRYLIKTLQSRLGFGSIPVKVYFRGKKDSLKKEESPVE